MFDFDSDTFRQIVDFMPSGLVIHEKGKIVFVNRLALQLIQAQDPSEVLGRDVLEFIAPESRDLVIQRLKALEHQTSVPPILENMIRTDGSIFQVEVAARVFKYQDKTFNAVTLHDLSQKLKLQEERESQLITLSLLDECVVELDKNLLIQSIGGSTQPIGENAIDLIGQPIIQSIHPDYKYYVTVNLQKLLVEKRQRLDLRFPIVKAGNQNRWIEGKFLPMPKSKKGIRGVLVDVTLDYLHQKQMNYLSYQDFQTGLPNRLKLEEHIQKCLVRLEREGIGFAIACIDVDKFADINETLGHKIGDQLIVAIADRLRDSCVDGQMVYRWGGDEFVFVFPHTRDILELRKTGDQIIRLSKIPFEIEEEKLYLTFSAGLVLSNSPEKDVDELLGLASRSMVYSKSQGRNQYQIASELPDTSSDTARMQLRNRLPDAIHHKEIIPYFQVQVDAKTRRIVGVEALARWPGREDGKIGPGIFIPLAENLGLISDLGDEVFRSSLAVLSNLHTHYPSLYLSVNVSRRQLFAHDFVSRQLSILEEFRIPPEQIILEITESIAMLEIDVAPLRLKELHGAGFQLSIDDFGTGYSALSQLHEMPVDEIKIDRSFVNRIHSREGFRLIQAIVEMASALELKSIAEGVEDNETAVLLRDIGIDILQGNHFGVPIPAEALPSLLAKKIA